MGVAGVQFLVDNNPVAAEDITSPYGVSWNTATVANGTHIPTALARDINGNTATSAPVTLTVANAATPGTFQNEVLATGLDLPTAIEVPARRAHAGVELGGKIKVLPPLYAGRPHPSCSSPMSARK